MNKKAFIMATITVLLWASSFAGIRVSLIGGYSPSHLVLLRFLIASAVFIIYAMVSGDAFKLPKKKDIVRIVILGWIGISVYHVGLTFGVQTIAAGTAGMIIGSAPIFTAIIAAIFLKEKLNKFSWIGLGVGFTGITLIALDTAGPSFTISKSALLVVIAAIATSIFFTFQKPLLSRYNPINLTAYFTWAGTLPLLIFLPGLFESIKVATVEAHVSTIFIGVFPAAIAYVTWAIALSLGNVGTITSMLYVEPVIAIFIAWIWLDEWPATLSLIGGGIAVSSVIIVNLSTKKKYKESTNW